MQASKPCHSFPQQWKTAENNNSSSSLCALFVPLITQIILEFFTTHLNTSELRVNMIYKLALRLFLKGIEDDRSRRWIIDVLVVWSVCKCPPTSRTSCWSCNAVTKIYANPTPASKMTSVVARENLNTLNWDHHQLLYHRIPMNRLGHRTKPHQRHSFLDKTFPEKTNLVRLSRSILRL